MPAVVVDGDAITVVTNMEHFTRLYELEAAALKYSAACCAYGACARAGSPTEAAVEDVNTASADLQQKARQLVGSAKYTFSSKSGSDAVK